MARENECGLFQTRNWITRREPGLSEHAHRRQGTMIRAVIRDWLIIKLADTLDSNGEHVHDNGCEDDGHIWIERNGI